MKFFKNLFQHGTTAFTRVHSTHSRLFHFEDVLPSQSLGTVLKQLNITQQKHTYTNYTTKQSQRAESNTVKLKHAILV